MSKSPKHLSSCSHPDTTCTPKVVQVRCLQASPSWGTSDDDRPHTCEGGRISWIFSGGETSRGLVLVESVETKSTHVKWETINKTYDGRTIYLLVVFGKILVKGGWFFFPTDLLPSTSNNPTEAGVKIQHGAFVSPLA